MVITIEPGIYVPPDSSFPKEFHNIGIRIEVRGVYPRFTADYSCPQLYFQDEVLIQKDHAIVLSINAPKEVCLFVDPEFL